MTFATGLELKGKGHMRKPINRARLQDSIRLWREKVPTYKEPHFAKTPVTVKPQNVDVLLFGHHMSCVFSEGVRTWMFNSQMERDRFVNYYRNFNAIPCGNPYPPQEKS